MSVNAEQAPLPTLPAYRGHGYRAAFVLVGGCAAIVSIALLLSGVTIEELLLFAGFQIVFAILPGLLSYLLLVERSQPPIDALAIAIPLGLAIQIGCFILTAAIGERWLFSIYPIVFIAASVPFVYRRRATLTPTRSPESLPILTRGVALASLLITLAVLFVIYLSVFAANPLPREIHSASYYPDLIFNISLTAEILHHWPFMNPSVSGVALHYHIFVNIAMAATAQITRLNLSTIVLRLEPTFLIALIALELFALGRKVGGSLAAGVTTLILGMFAGEVNFSWLDLANGGIPALGLLFSPSYQLGAVFFLAVCTVLIDRKALGARNSRVGYALGLGILSFGAVGAKASVIPILIAGFALFILGQVPLHGAKLKAIRLSDIRSFTVIAAVGIAGYVLIYSGGGEGLTLKPLNFLAYTGFASVYRQASHSPLHALLAIVGATIVLCVLLLSLIGVLFIRERWLPLRAASSAERLLLCMFAASLAPFVLIAVPGDSQVYFIAYGFLAASAVSAAGVTAAMRALDLGAAEILRPVLVCGTGVLAVIVILWKGSSTVALVPAYGLLACIVIVTVWLLRRRTSAATASGYQFLALGAIVLVCLTMASEVFEQTSPTIDRWLRGEHAFQPSGVGVHHGVTTDLLRGLEWVRNHTPPSAVIAINNHDVGGEDGARYVYYSAFSERRVFLESWQYTSQDARYASLGKTETPFPRLLAINDAAVLHASPAAISLLHDRYGVRYIVIDRHHGPPPSPDLDRFAQLVYANPDVAVLRVE